MCSLHLSLSLSLSLFPQILSQPEDTDDDSFNTFTESFTAGTRHVS